MSRRSIAHTAKVTAATTAMAAAGVVSVLTLPASPAFAACKNGDDSLSIFGTTRTGENVYLHEGSHLRIGDGVPNGRGSSVPSDKKPADDLGPEVSQEWVVKAWTPWCGDYGPSSVEISLQYRLYDRANKPTDFWVKAYFRTPWIGRNSGGCAFYKGKPGEQGVKTGDAPFTCGWSNFAAHEWDTHPILDIKAT